MIIYYSNTGNEDYGQGIVIDGKNKKIPVLVSYYGMKKNYTKPNWVGKLMLDSGAFSAWRQHTSIDVDAYIEFCLQHHKYYDAVIALDVVNKPRTSFDNFKRMQKAGLDVVPVYHIDEPLSFLYKLCDECSYVGIGGIAWVYRKTKHIFLRKVFNDFPDPSKIGFHGFGINDIDIMTTYPWKTVDATSAHRRARVGLIYTPWTRNLSINPTVPAVRLKWWSDMKVATVDEYLKGIGVDPQKVKLHDGEGIKERCKANIIFLEHVAMTCPKKYSSRSNQLM